MRFALGDTDGTRFAEAIEFVLGVSLLLEELPTVFKKRLGVTIQMQPLLLGFLSISRITLPKRCLSFLSAAALRLNCLARL